MLDIAPAPADTAILYIYPILLKWLKKVSWAKLYRIEYSAMPADTRNRGAVQGGDGAGGGAREPGLSLSLSGIHMGFVGIY